MTAFINNISINSSMIYLDTQERQLGKGQDIAISGKNLLNKNGKLCDWFLVADGHGGFLTINIIKKLIADDKLAEIITTNEPMDVLVAYMKTQFIGSNSGTTCIIVKIFEDNMIQCWNVGDSQVAIYVNKQLHYISCPHNMKNPLEQVRLADRIRQGRVHIEKMENYVPVIATKTTMNPRIGEYIYFGNTKLAMSQALGDGWLTGIAPEKFEYTFDPTDEVRIVGATDGYWEHYIFEGPDAAEDLADITTLPADELIEKMEQRWKKEDWQYFWNPKDTSKSIVTNYDGDYDDIGLAIWSNRMPTDSFTNPLTNPKIEVEKVETVTALDADQQAALDLWQTLNPVKVEPLWTGDGQDPDFDAKAAQIFQDYVNGLIIKEKEEEKDEPDTDLSSVINENV
jgi:serine/threonine protein phosphatase PrpC